MMITVIEKTVRLTMKIRDTAEVVIPRCIHCNNLIWGRHYFLKSGGDYHYDDFGIKLLTYNNLDHGDGQPTEKDIPDLIEYSHMFCYIHYLEDENIILHNKLSSSSSSSSSNYDIEELEYGDHSK